MVAASVATVLALSDYRTADLESILQAEQTQTQTITATQAPDGRVLLVSVLDPAQRAAREADLANTLAAAKAGVPRSISAVGNAASADAAEKAPAVQLAAVAPAADAATNSDELVGPPMPDPAVLASRRAADEAAIVLAKQAPVAAKADSAATVGPSAPPVVDRTVVLAAAPTQPQEGEFVGPPMPTAADRAVGNTMLAADKTSIQGELVGPVLPPGWTPGQGVVLASAMHPLPFTHLPVPSFSSPTPEPTPAKTVSAERDFEEFLASADDESANQGLRGLRHQFRWGETLSQVIGRAGVAADQVDEWVEATNGEYDVDRVYAGQEIELYMEARAAGALARLRMEIDPETLLIVERRDGSVRARREEIPYDRVLRAAGGEIDRSLYVTAQSRGIPDTVISDMAEILGWDIDLASDIDEGASFQVVYEELTRPDTMETVPGRLLAVRLFNRGKQHEGFYFAMPGGKQSGYYDRNGNGIGRGFLRFPVAFTRVTSNFSSARFHPILKRSVPHYGVDFAAPTGTPVRAVADGRVLKAAWNGGNGKFVKIQHDGVYETSYSHLSRISPSLHAGGTVKQGQIIGYVGATGLATGPHLHFAMYRSGKYIDPLKADLPRTQSLAGKELAAFRMRVDMLEGAYANVGQPRVPAQLAGAIGTAAMTAGGGAQ